MESKPSDHGQVLQGWLLYQASHRCISVRLWLDHRKVPQKLGPDLVSLQTSDPKNLVCPWIQTVFIHMTL